MANRSSKAAASRRCAAQTASPCPPLAPQVGPGWCTTPLGEPLAAATGASPAGACAMPAVLMRDVALSQPNIHRAGGGGGGGASEVEISYKWVQR